MRSSRAGAGRAVPVLLALALMLGVTASSEAAKLSPDMSGKLDRTLSRTLAGTESPGAIVGVWVGGKRWTAAKGSTIRGADIRPTRSIHTRIGSVTKTFTGTVILQLARERKLRLDDSIDRWFPWVPDAGRITIRDLGSMASGINTYSASGAVTDRYLTHPRTVWKPAELIETGVSLPPRFAPGEGFFYSNTNFLMLGRIAEKVTGKPLARLYRERIFDRLGMGDSSYPSTTALPRPFWHGDTNQAVTGTPIRDATHWSPTFLGAAGQIVSTLSDLGRYTRALGTGSLVGPAMQRQRLRPNPASVVGGRQYGFALGDDHGWLSHSGEVPGFNTQIAYLPSRRATVVILTNTDIPDADGLNPAPAIFTALAEVISPGHVPGS